MKRNYSENYPGVSKRKKTTSGVHSEVHEFVTSVLSTSYPRQYRDDNDPTWTRKLYI